jgi:hypothetical protein
MFPPQFGLYEQVKQSQLEMERSAQLDLEIELADQDAPSLPTRLGGWFSRWTTRLQQSFSQRPASLAVRLDPKGLQDH